MSDHMAGPWHRLGKSVRAIDRRGEFSIGRFDSRQLTDVCNEANAQVAAAAPDLLAALRMCADFIENVDESTPDRTERFFACRESWRRAIARAEAQS